MSPSDDSGTGCTVESFQGNEVAIQAAAGGEAIFGPSVVRRLIDFFSAEGPATAPVRAFAELTTAKRRY